jgi:hypothetical protein
MTRGVGTVLGTTGAISVVTAINRLDVLPTRFLASSPASFESGRVWLLCTSALLADRPAGASIVGFAVVGLAVYLMCGDRVAWLAAVTGHVGSAVLVYSGIVLARLADPAAFHTVFAYSDYGTSAVIAAWIGAIGYRVWAGGARLSAAALCVVSGLVAWLFKNQLTVLDVEHVVALGFGVLAMRYAPHLPRIRVDRRRPRLRSARAGISVSMTE